MTTPFVTLVAMTALFASLRFAPPAHAADVSPGKNVALAHVNLFQDSYTINATIEKGKKKHVLIIHSEANVIFAQALTYCLGPDLSVNGIVQLAQPSPGQGVACITSCNNDACTIHGTYFVDLDAAELAHPGMFYNQPVTVHHSGGPQDVGGVSTGNAVLTVMMQKK